jgi:hypothetical protein
MKLAYLGPTGVFGGVRILVEHCNRLADRGHDVTLISISGQPVNWLPTRFEQRPASDSGAGYDVVVGTAVTTWPQTISIANGQRAFGLFQMCDWLFYSQDSKDYIDTLSDFTTPVEVLAISEWLAQLAEASDHTTHRIRNGIDTRLFYHDDFPDVPPFDGLTIVTEGYSHNRCKDVDEYYKRAIRHLKWDKGRRVRAIGFSQYPAAFEFDAYWQTPGQDIIRKIYSTGDIFLKASRYEGRPGPDLEAMACGAVVCRAIGTGGDDLRDEYNCLVVPYGEYDQFVANCERLMDDMPLRERLRENAREYVKTHCDWDGAIDLVEMALTGSVTKPDPAKAYAYELKDYNALQSEILGWETPQAMWLGETLADMLQPKAVIDIGCGPGTYLVPFKPQARVLGVDGAPEAGQALEKGEFVTADFREDWQVPNWFEIGNGQVAHLPAHWDLSLCVETAEHLPPDRADYLVDLLTGCSDVCFFSAAHPGQGGTLHLNEQPREWWLEKFQACGWALHPRNTELMVRIAANPYCRAVQWLLPNAMLIGKVNHAQPDQ